ncbi:MAG TPA: sulfate permease [Gaiellaceae bacterium]|nr:sulfate permease [Gaiellaceae bacterium]
MNVTTGTETERTTGPRRATSLVPGIAVARRYRRAWLRHDVVAGIVLTALLVPQGLAYAELAGLPAVAGLYATLVPLLAYALVGPSRILVLGPDSALAPIVAAAVVPLAGADPDERVALAGLLALMVGALLLAGGIARLGFLTDLISKPVRTGYLGGIAVIVIFSQVPRLLGFDVSEGDVLDDLSGLVRGLDDVDATTAAIGIACLTVILGAQRFAPVLPVVLIAVVGATALVSVFDLSVDVVGEVPSGLPSPTIPSPSVEDLGRLMLSALAIALLAFADTSILSRSYASRLGERVDQSRELAALGVSNIATGLTQGFPISSSSSRTPVAEAAGSRTQLTGVVAALLLAAVLIAGTGLLADIPQTALAAVVIAAVTRLVDVSTLRRLFRVHRADFALAVAALLSVVVFGILPGVGIAIGLSVLAVLQRGWRPYTAVLGRVRDLKGYHDVVRHPEGQQVPGMLLFRFDAPLFFANAEVFRDGVHRAVAAADGRVRVVVVAAEPITHVDSTAAEVLAELYAELERQGIELGFAELKGPVKDRLRRYGLFDRIGEEHFYPTIGLAVRSYVDEHGIPWQDWEEER